MHLLGGTFSVGCHHLRWGGSIHLACHSIECSCHGLQGISNLHQHGIRPSGATPSLIVWGLVDLLLATLRTSSDFSLCWGDGVPVVGLLLLFQGLSFSLGGSLSNRAASCASLLLDACLDVHIGGLDVQPLLMVSSTQ